MAIKGSQLSRDSRQKQRRAVVPPYIPYAGSTDTKLRVDDFMKDVGASKLTTCWFDPLDFRRTYTTFSARTFLQVAMNFRIKCQAVLRAVERSCDVPD